MNDATHPEGQVLQAYHDGELEASAAADVAEHCRNCESCRAELDQLRELGRMLAGVETPEMSRSVWQNLQRGREREVRIKPLFAMAACAAGIVLGVLMGPLQLGESTAADELTGTETLNVWNAEATSSLLGVYESGLE